MSQIISLYCKSFRTDVRRTVRLANSVHKFNIENIPFYISVPRMDVNLFKEHLVNNPAVIIEDESILECNTKIDMNKFKGLHGGTSQQIVKSEFWRTGLSDAYVCLDSDSMFIRPFHVRDFISTNLSPYTVIDEGHELLDLALQLGKLDILENFYRESIEMQNIFGRQGKSYSFGPNPPIWHRNVWESLDKEYLSPRGMSFYDATLMAPVDLNWYGEALLKYKAIPLLPCQPLFKVYHYAWQLDDDTRANIGHVELSKIYSGVIYQSAWDRKMDWPSEGGALPSRIARRLRRLLRRV